MRPEGSGFPLPLLAWMEDDEERRMGQTVAIEDFTADAGFSAT